MNQANIVLDQASTAIPTRRNLIEQGRKAGRFLRD